MSVCLLVCLFVGWLLWLPWLVGLVGWLVLFVGLLVCLFGYLNDCVCVGERV